MAFDRDRGGRSFGRRDSHGRGFDRPREMTKVTCSNCGKETEVPFRPTGDRPVYCRDCFAKMGGGDRRDSRPPFKRFDDNRPQGPNNSTQLSEINAKLDRLIELLSPKIEEKPIELPTEKEVAKTRSTSSGRAKKAVKKIEETPEKI